MATILDKDVIRESTIKYDNREIIVTLTEDQKISFKLKGMKTGIVSISIEDLYKQLVGEPTKKAEKSELRIVKKNDGEKYNGGPLVPLNDFRSHNLISTASLDVKLQVEKVLCEILKDDTIKV